MAARAHSTATCRTCGGEILSGDRRHKHCSDACAVKSKQLHRNARQSAYRLAYPDREKAKLTLGYAIRSGHMRRVSRCEDCGERKLTEGHHSDYSRPFYVTWLCRACHAQLEDGRHFGAGQRKSSARPHAVEAGAVARGATASPPARPASVAPSSSALTLRRGARRA